MKKILLYSLVILSSYLNSVGAIEKDWGFFIRGSRPEPVMWNREQNGNWTLVAMFEGATLTTYFKNGPNSDKFELGLSPHNLPFKQVFEYRRTGKTYESTSCEYSQFENGLKMCSFTYNEKFSISGNKFESIDGTLVERPKNFIDNDLPKSEIRYDLWKKSS